MTHLQEVLNAADFEKHGFSKVVVWAPESTLARIGEVEGLVSRSHPLIEKAGIHAYFFRSRVLDKLIDSETALLWCPGSTCNSRFKPYVTMVRNFLPFVKEERDRFKYSKVWARLMYLRWVQERSFRKADGLIHISYKAETVINDLMDLSGVKQRVIHHGLNPRFIREPREQFEFSRFSSLRPVNIVYVSAISPYKHHETLIRAVAGIRSKGIPVVLNLVGPANTASEVLVDSWRCQYDSDRSWLLWHGEKPYSEVQRFYQEADISVFMSSCETFGNILLEAMASGLPILCSNRSALPEIHAGACLRVDPEDLSDVETKLELMIRDSELREHHARAAYERAQTFSWRKCADETFQFLASCAK